MTARHGTVVIIGAGVVGAAIGLEFARRGWETTIVDRGPAPGHGSTAASSAVIRFAYSTYTGTAMAYDGAEYWRRWADHVRLPEGAPLTTFVECGVLFFDDPSGAAKGSLPILDDVGVTYEVWNTDELHRRLPHLSTSSWFPPTPVAAPAFSAEPTALLHGAVFTPEGGYITDPQLAANNLADAAVLAGARLRLRAEVVDVCCVGGRVSGVVFSDGEVLGADVVINAAGPHSSFINRLAGVLDDMTVSTVPLRQQVTHVRIPDGVAIDIARHPVTADIDSGIYFRGDHQAFLIGGVEADCDPLIWLDDADDVDLELDADEWEAQAFRLARRIPELGVPHDRRGVVGVYDVTEDWMPILDRSSLDGFYMAVGTSGNQFKNAPIIGYCMAELVEAVEGGHDHDRDPLVVRSPHKGLPLDLGTFSRRRATTEDQRSRGVLG